MVNDPTLTARILLSGAAVEIPAVTRTVFRPAWGGYCVAIECEDIDLGIYQWCTEDALEEVVRMMVTLVWAASGKLEAA